MIKHYSDNQVQYVIRYAHKHSHGRQFFEVIINVKHVIRRSSSSTAIIWLLVGFLYSNDV